MKKIISVSAATQWESRQAAQWKKLKEGEKNSGMVPKSIMAADQDTLLLMSCGKFSHLYAFKSPYMAILSIERPLNLPRVSKGLKFF